MKKAYDGTQNLPVCHEPGENSADMYTRGSDGEIIREQEVLEHPNMQKQPQKPKYRNQMADRGSVHRQGAGSSPIRKSLMSGAAGRWFKRELLSAGSVTILMAAVLFLSGCGQKKEAPVQLWEQIPGQEQSSLEAEEEDHVVPVQEGTGSGETSEEGQNEVADSQETTEDKNEADTSGKTAGYSEEGTSSGVLAGDNGQQASGLPETAGWTKAPVLSLSQWTDNRYDQDGTLLVDGGMESIEVSGEGYEQVSASIRSWWEKEEQDFSRTIEEYQYQVEDPESRWPDFAGCRYHVESYGTRADSSVISFQCLYEEYSGGAHGNYWAKGMNFQVSTGKQLSFWDLSQDRKAFSQKTLELCLAQLEEREADNLFPDYEDFVRQTWQEEPEWYLDGGGIRIVFSPYEIATYARGLVEVMIPYQDLEGLLLPEFQMGTRAGTAVFPEGQEVSLCLGKGGERYPVQIRMEERQPEEEGFRSYVLQVGEQQLLIEWDRLCAAYLIQREDGRSFLLFYGDYASDDFETHVYEITDGQIRKTQEPLGSAMIRENLVTQDSIELGLRVDALGTYRAYAPYRLTEEGTLEPQQEWYHIAMGYGEGYGILTNQRELPVVMDGVHTILPAGSRIRLTGTDLKGRLSFILQDSGEEGEIHYTSPEHDWKIYIDGVAEDEYFDELPYAG